MGLGLKTGFRALLGTALLAGGAIAVEWGWGWAALLAPWTTMRWDAVVAAFGLVALSYGARSARLVHYFRRELARQFWPAARLTVLHNLLNNLMPFRSGELSFPVLMRHFFRIELVRSTAALVWFRLVDLHCVLVLGAVCMLQDAAQPVLLVLLLVALTLALGALPALRAALERRLRAAAGPDAVARGWQRLLLRALAGLPADAATFWGSIAWTWIGWLLKLAAFGWVLMQFVPIAWSAGWVAAIGGDLMSVVPLNAPGGFGTYEAGVVAGLAAYGVALADALPAAINLHLFLLGGSILLGAWPLLVPHDRAELRAAMAERAPGDSKEQADAS
ncbi:MAG: flippase-like domain-containing protein [Burkholderiales bacterium]|nr:MAG: flippase-like domain-containing protein [Burkholderiales bacterium]